MRYEYNEIAYYNVAITSFGLNIKQNPYVSYKLDYTVADFDDPSESGEPPYYGKFNPLIYSKGVDLDFSLISLSMAVSF